MSKVEFEQDEIMNQFKHDIESPIRDAKGFAGWLLRHDIVSTEAQAKFILVGIIVLNFLVAFLIMKTLVVG